MLNKSISDGEIPYFSRVTYHTKYLVRSQGLLLEGLIAKLDVTSQFGVAKLQFLLMKSQFWRFNHVQSQFLHYIYIYILNIYIYIHTHTPKYIMFGALINQYSLGQIILNLGVYSLILDFFPMENHHRQQHIIFLWYISTIYVVLLNIIYNI